MECKANDWIEHSAFGLGWIREDRGDRLDIQFVTSGTKTVLKTAQFSPAVSPPGFHFPKTKGRSGTPRFKVERPPRRPPLDFDHLVEGFTRFFHDGGFDSPEFEKRESGYKKKAADDLERELGKDICEGLLRDGRYAEVCKHAKSIINTNLVFKLEKLKFRDGFKDVTKHEPFANALYSLLYDSGEMEPRFSQFCNLLSEMGANKWPIATYFQFLGSNGKSMFMKPEVMKKMADSLNVSLNYKPEPNWLTYPKLQELADRVELELQNRQLKPRSRMDVQGFIWASIKIEEGKYGKKGGPQESDKVDE
jgi:hypothetical protein